MKKLLFTISIAVIASLNILAQGYRNPVLPGFHADFDWFEYTTE